MPETCQGNKIYYLDESRSSLQLVLTHLKNSHRRSFIPVSFTLPQELTAIFIPLIEVARPKLMRTFEEHPYLFINPNTGAALAAQQVSQAFRKAFAPDVRILVPSPRECRSVDNNVT